jgi:AcrR family transcriptional regulator
MTPRRRASAGTGDRDGARTRERLLDAAVECLIELGVNRTTTLAVQRRAGVSRGALLHHFPTHAELLAASVAELVKRNERAVAASRRSVSNAHDPLQEAVNALAFAGRQPPYLAELELWAIARTDRPLKQALVGAERAAKREIDRVCAELFGKWAASDAYPDMVALTQHFVRGLAISENLGSSSVRRERLIAAWTEAMRMMLTRGLSRATQKVQSTRVMTGPHSRPR